MSSDVARWVRQMSCQNLRSWMLFMIVSSSGGLFLKSPAHSLPTWHVSLREVALWHSLPQMGQGAMGQPHPLLTPKRGQGLTWKISGTLNCPTFSWLAYSQGVCSALLRELIRSEWQQ